MEKTNSRIKVIEKIAEYEKNEMWDKDVEEDLPTIPLLPNKVDYLNKKLSSKIATKFSNYIAIKYFEDLIKKKQLIIKEIVGIDNYLSVQGGAILTCNHFSHSDNYAVYRVIKPYLKKRELYKVIKEGNFTNFSGFFGFLFKHSNTLPLSSNVETMKKFLFATKTLLSRGEKILIYPEQAMWWNYRKPRPMKSGAFNIAVKNNVPIIPFFITMADSDVLDSDGYYVQEYTMNILKPIYPKKELTDKENMKYLSETNYMVWKETYETFYNKKLTYEGK